MVNKKVESNQMSMSEKLIYSFRGLVAFVAFMDIGLAIRSFVEKRTFLNEYTQIQIDKNGNNAVITRILGIFYLLKATTVIHCALYPHYKPVVSIGVCSCTLTVLMYLLEALVYHSAALDFHIVYSCVLNVVTAAGLIMLPSGFQKHLDEDYDENQELTRQIGFLRNQKKIATNIRNKSK